MSDEEEFMSESESGEDFSASEDEWLPEKESSQGKKRGTRNQDITIETSESEEEVESSEVESAESDVESPRSSQKKKKQSRPKRQPGKAKKPTFNTSKRILFAKYKTPTRPNNQNRSVISTALSDILKKSEFRSKKLNSSQDDSQKSPVAGKEIQQKKSAEDDDSGSSGDEHLVNPDQLDFNSEFFNVKEQIASKDKLPDFDCNVGVPLSEDSDFEEVADDKDDTKETTDKENELPAVKKQTSKLVAHINQGSSKAIDLQELHKFNQQLEDAKKQLKTFESKNFREDNVNVSQLLALGEADVESKPKSSQKPASKKRKQADTDSEWEDVNEDQTEANSFNSNLNKDLQITVELPDNIGRRVTKEIDVEACLKRKLNRIKKERQVDMHKVHLLCWIAYGNRIGLTLNNPNLYKHSLRTLPTPVKQVYPKDKTDIKYYEQITKWFRQAYALKSETVYPTFKPLPPLATSLALQISKKQAICKRDYVLCFIILLRAMGFQARLVHSLITVPIRPPQSELCKISVNKEKTFKKYKSPQKESKEKETTSLAELKKGRKKPEIKEDPKPEKKRKRVSTETDESSSSKRPTRDKSGKRKADDSGKTVQKKAKTDLKIDQLDGANDAGPSTSRKTAKKNAESKTKGKILSKTEPELDSPFKKILDNNSSENRSPTIKKVQAFAAVGKPKLKRLTEINVLEAGIVPSPRKTRAQRIKEGTEISKSGTALSKVTRNLTELEGCETEQMKKSPKIVHTTETQTKTILKSKSSLSNGQLDDSLKSRRKSVTFKDDSAIPSTSKSPEPTASKSKSAKSKKKPIILPKSDDEDDFAQSPILERPKPVIKRIAQIKSRDRRLVSTDEEDLDATPKFDQKLKINLWIEVYAEKEKRWITIDLFKGKVDSVEDICRTATTPIAYVLAWNNDNTIKDVSPRYCEHWNTTTRKLRVEKEWWDESIRPFLGKLTERDKAENKYFDKIHSAKPHPTVISDFKDHPLYALERHLLKFEALYPPDAPPVGWIRSEPIYARECVYTLHTREKWVKEARVVKLNETPYKIVKARPKWDRYTNTVIKDLPLEVFGIWQTQPYEPPTAENGIVPRNAYGNVELFKECMLPKKTVHLRLNGLNKVCKKLNIDCAPAVIGFDFHSGSSHPVYDGFVICEEFQEIATDAWVQEQDEMERKEQEKIDKRIYGNWKRLIKGLLIRERLQAKYNFGNDDESEDEAGGSNEKKPKKKPAQRKKK